VQTSANACWVLHNGPTMSPEPSPSLPPLYAQIAQRMARMMEDQVFKAGQRLPSVREVATQNGVSVSTAVQALRWLEERHLVTAKPKAGYFVSPRRRGAALPAVSRPPTHSMVIEHKSRCELLSTLNDEPCVVSFGAYAPEDHDFFDHDKIRVALARAIRVHRKTLVEYSEACGTPALRQAVARRALHLGCQLQPDNIIITASCTHGVGLCLRAVTKPGDVVALESPTSAFWTCWRRWVCARWKSPPTPRAACLCPRCNWPLTPSPSKPCWPCPLCPTPWARSCAMPTSGRWCTCWRRGRFL